MPLLYIAYSDVGLCVFHSVLAPGLLKYTAKVDIALISREVKDFFIKVAKKTIEARELQGKEVICLSTSHV